MSVYYLLTNLTATTPATTNGTVPLSAVAPWGGTNPNVPPTQQSFEATAVASAGNASATVQIYGSNDDSEQAQYKNWVKIGDPLVVPGTYLNAAAGFTTNASFKHYGATLTAVSGTNTAVTVKMSA